jgi:hypothetical protein
MAGHPIATHGGLTGYIDTPRELCLIVRNVTVGQVTPDGHAHELSLTNLRFSTDSPDPIAFDVQWDSATIPVRLIPRRNYQDRLRQLAKTRGIVPTALLRFRSTNLTGGAVNEFIMDLCHALSIVQGRKINWIYHATFGPGRVFQHAVFGETVTKRDTAQPLCFVPTTRTGVTPDLTAAKDAISAIKRFRQTFDPNNRLINSWLDARTETDYLEARTLKYVVVIEALIAMTVRVAKTIPKSSGDPEAWERLYSDIVKAVPAVAKSLTLPRWRSLNARSFRDTLAAVCDVNHVTVSVKDVALFTRIRNALVHRFAYDSDIKLPGQWNVPDQPQIAQHFFAAEFVDRIILQLFGLRKHLQPGRQEVSQKLAAGDQPMPESPESC